MTNAELEAASLSEGLTPDLLHRMKVLILATNAAAQEDGLLDPHPGPQQRIELQRVGQVWAAWCTEVADRGRSIVN